MSGFGKIYESSNWGVGVCDNTIGWGSSYKSIANCTDASFSYSADSFAQNGSNPTPTITGDAGGTFTATPSGLSLNASTGEITLSTSTINSYTIRYTLPDTTFAEQTVGITAAPFSSTRSFSFDGVNDYFDADISALNNATALTFSGWVKKTSGNVVGFESFNGSTDRAILYWWSDNNVYWSVRNGSASAAASSSLTTYDWNHIAGTFEGSTNTIKLYINGSLVDTQTGQPSSTSGNLSNNFHIGLSNGSTYSNGSIDEVGIWANSALSSAAITEIYNSGVPNDLDELTNASDPTVWYRMGE